MTFFCSTSNIFFHRTLVSVTAGDNASSSTRRGNDMSSYLTTIKNNMAEFDSFNMKSVKVGKYIKNIIMPKLNNL